MCPTEAFDAICTNVYGVGVTTMISSPDSLRKVDCLWRETEAPFITAYLSDEAQQ